MEYSEKNMNIESIKTGTGQIANEYSINFDTNIPNEEKKKIE